MADNYLITGYWGEPHVTAENDRGIHAATFGTGRFVLPVGEQFRAEYIGNNTIRIHDGKLMNNGAAAGIPVGEYVDLLIANAGQGKKRNDLIVFQYSQDPSTLIESGVFTVIQGTETSGTASDPALKQADLLSGEATFDQMALWRVPVTGTTISAPVKLFSVWNAYAPAGYGLGEPTGRYASDLNTAITGGLWWTNADTKNLPSSAIIFSTVFVKKRLNGEIVQEIQSMDGNKYELTRWSTDGGATWRLEWKIPPMLLGVEYRTTERWNGKEVYTMMSNIGVLPNNTGKTTEGGPLPMGIAPISAYGIGLNGKTGAVIPSRHIYLSVYGEWGTVYVNTDSDYSNYTGYIIVKYVKD